MKKISLLLMMMLVCSISVMAQNTVPKPLNPELPFGSWVDSDPIVWPDNTITTNSQVDISFGQDFMGNFVADDYYFDIDELIVGECNYTKLDADKISFSIYTDFNRIFTFNPEDYEEFTEPTTKVPYSIFDGPDGDGSSTYSHFAWNAVHFAKETNNGVDLGIKRFFYWRLGVQVHYTVDGVTNSSDIVYYYPAEDEWNIDNPEMFYKPNNGDLNHDGIIDIEDVNICINIILSKDYDIVGDMTEDGEIDVADMNEIINIILTQNNN